LVIFSICLAVAAGAAMPPVSLAGQPDYAGLHKAEPAERAKTVQAIRQAGDVEAVPLLMAQLADPDPAVGLYVAQALGDLADAQALAGLRADLASRDPNVRFRAALALGKRGDVAAVYALSRVLRDPDVLVQRAAAEALAQIGTPDAIEALASALNSTQDSIIYNAMNALQSVGGAAVPGLLKALGSNNPVVRLHAATVLGYIKDPAALPALGALAADRDPDVVKEAAWAIIEIQKRR
jgi:HEAT repeat protein